MIYKNSDGIILELLDTGESFFNGHKCNIKKIIKNVFEICCDNEFSLSISIINNTFNIINRPILLNATYGTETHSDDVTETVNNILNTSQTFLVNNKMLNYSGPDKWKKLTLYFHNMEKPLVICEHSFFSFTKINDIKEKFTKYKIKEKKAHDLLLSYDENTDYFEDNMLITIVNHTTKSGFVVSKYDTYAGFYCFVHYFTYKIRDILFFHKYTLTDICSLDGFTLYKDNYEDDAYRIIFKIKDIESTTNNILEKYFDESDVVKKTREYLINKYSLDVKSTLGVYYRGTDKRVENKLPDTKLYSNEIINQIKTNKFKKVLLQSDSHTVLKNISEDIRNFCNIEIVILEEMPVSYDDNKSAFHNQNTDRVKTAIFFNAVLRIIADCNTIILNRNSNVSRYVMDIRDKTQKTINIS